jgi:hopanoid-associated phosphorylase
VTILAVTGLLREAKIVTQAGVVAVAGGGNPARLREALGRMGTSAQGVISIGIAGGLAPHLKSGDCILASAVTDGRTRFPAHERWRDTMRTKLPHAVVAEVYGTDAILSDPEAKASLHRHTQAAAADMESHIAACFAAEHAIPFAVLRVVSDPVTGALPPAVRCAMSPDGSIRYGRVFASIARNPAQIPALMRTARESRIAFAELLRCVHALGPRFAAPDFG